MKRSPRTLAWLLPFGLLLTAIIAVPLRMLDARGLPRYRALEAELHDVTAHNDRLRRQVLDQQRAVGALRHDPNAIERIARDDLGMVKQGELVFQFPH